MPAFKGRDGSGKELRFVEEEGNVYPQGIVEFGMQNDLRKKLYAVRDFVTRDDDVFICAYAKAGSKWATSWENLSFCHMRTNNKNK